MPTSPSKTLETVPNPHPDRDYEVSMTVPEFTCLCPLTGQPDFATIRIRYVPDQHLVELKALKLYMWSYRDEGVFHEDVTNRILNDFVAAAHPRWVEVTGDFNVRWRHQDRGPRELRQAARGLRRAPPGPAQGLQCPKNDTVSGRHRRSLPRRGQREQNHAEQHHDAAERRLAHALRLAEPRDPHRHREQDLHLLHGLDVRGQRQRVRLALA